jgi:hypothetical protein
MSIVETPRVIMPIFMKKGFVWRFKNENIKDSERPLVVMIHGGPHGAIFN